MNITILDNRDVIINSSDNLGTQNENNASIINFSFPESLMNANKKIVFITDDGNYWDLITNNSYKITNAVSKYKNVSVYVWLVDEQNDIDFRSKIWNVSFNKNEEPDDIVPTEEEISGFDTMITQLNQGLEELDEEKIKLRREYEKVEEGLEDLDEALIQVNNVDIDASKTGNVATITITNKEGTEKPVQISDGTDYVITQEDYQAIANVVEQDIADEIPKKISDLENDSGFIDNTVNNLTNYTLKTNTGSLIDLEINSTTYVITLRLKDVDGNVISTDTVDLPLESVVVGGSYDSVNKKIVLTLENDNTVDILVGDLIAGLQTEITNNNKLASDLVDDTNSGNKFVTTSEKQTWNGKYNKPVGGIPKTDLSSAVQTSLGKADSALQEHQDISGKEDKTNKVTSIDDESTDTQYPSAKLLYDQLAEKQAEIDGLVAENSAFKKQISTSHISTTSTQLTDSAEDLPIEHVKIKGATSQVQYEGKNLWGGISYTKSSNSVDFEQKSDGSIIVNGTSTGNASSLMSADAVSNGYTKTLSAGTYVLSGGTSNVILQFVRSDGSTVASTTSQEFSKTFTLSAETVAFVRANVENGVTVNNETVYIQLEPGSTAHDWEPYVGGQASPNPSYPQTIHRVTGECNEKVENRNLLEITADSRLTHCSYVSGANTNEYKLLCTANDMYVNEIKAVGASYTSVNGNLIPCSYGETIYFDIGNSLFTKNFFSEYDENFVGLGYSQVSLSNGTYTPTHATCKYVTLRFGYGAGSTEGTTYTLAPIVCKTSDTSYIPHAEQNAPLSLGNIEAYEGDEIQISYVQKAGYKKVTGARFVKNMLKVVLDGTENISVSNSGTDNWFYSINFASNPKFSIGVQNSIGDVIKSNHYIKNSVINSDTNKGIAIYTNVIRIREQTESTIINFQNRLATLYANNTPVYVVYKLATPVTTPITDPTLLAQLETLINMKTYKEITNIESTGADLAPVIEFDYYQDMSTINSRIFSYDSATQTLTITI